MPSFDSSEKVTQEIRARLPSKTRTEQVKQLACRMTLEDVRKAVESGAFQLTRSITFGRDCPEMLFGFLGEEDEVLEKIRAVPLPKEGKKGTSRAALVNMVRDLCVKLDDEIRAYKKGRPLTLETIVLLRDTCLSHQSVVASMSGTFPMRQLLAWDKPFNRDLFDKFSRQRRHAAGTALHKVLDLFTDRSTDNKMANCLLRQDVDDQVLQEGWDLFSIKQIMEK